MNTDILARSQLTMRPSCLPTGRLKVPLKWKKKEWSNIMESPYRDLFKNTEIFPPLSLHLLNWNYFSVLFCLFYVKKLIMRLLIAGNVRPGHPGRYHFLQGTDVHRVFWVSVGDKKFISYFLRIPQRLMVTRVTIICTSSLLYFTVWLGQKYLLLFCIQSDCTASTLH